jgi:hypothetical protein
VDNSQPKKRFPLSRVARLTFRALALAMSLAFVVGWMVSYRGQALALHGLPGGREISFGTFLGTVSIGVTDLNALPGAVRNRQGRGWECDFVQRDVEFRNLVAQTKPFIVQFGVSDYLRFAVTAPYWFLTTLAAMAAALSFKRTWRFTTRQLLLATTAVALLLGAMALSMRG